MTLTYEFELTAPEQVRATRLRAHRRWSTRFVYIILVACALLVYGLEARARMRGHRGWWAGVPAITLLALVGCGVNYFSANLMVRNLRRNNRAALGPHAYSFGDGGLDVASPGIKASVEWPNFAEVFESYEFLLLYISKGQAVVLPKRVVTDIKALRQLLQERAAPGAKMRLATP